jgi:hypothetical protein
MSRILPIRAGWDPSPTDDAFYPDDLPEEWRLAYFSNELQGVLLEPVLWRRADAKLLEQWAADVPASFRIYLDIEDAGVVAAERAIIQAHLGDRFGGWVADSDAVAGFDERAPIYTRVGTLSAAAASPAGSLACEVPDGLASDLRAARAWLDRLNAAAKGRPTLAVMGPARFEDVLRWQSLVYLLGFG